MKGHASRPDARGEAPEEGGGAPKEDPGGEEEPKPQPLPLLKEEEERARGALEGEEKERRVWESKAGLHPLLHQYTFWYTRRVGRGAAGGRVHAPPDRFEDNVKQIQTFSTVEAFWSCYCRLGRPPALPQPTDFHLFRDGIRPLWEDAGNRNGGKWILRFKKGVVSRFWEDLILAIVGDQLECAETVCGAVLSIRFNEDLISIWSTSASETQAAKVLRDSIKKHMNLPNSYIMEYKPHDMSLRDNSSFRNTWIGA